MFEMTDIFSHVFLWAVGVVMRECSL